MALRYITTGNFPDQQSQARGTLLDILTSQGSPNTLADADDVPGVRLEWMNGAWYGDCGFPSAAQHSELLAANAYNSLALGAKATLPSGPVTWRGAGSGGVGISRCEIQTAGINSIRGSIQRATFAFGGTSMGAKHCLRNRLHCPEQREPLFLRIHVWSVCIQRRSDSNY